MLAIHGRYKIEVDGQVVKMWFADAWNEEAVIAYIKDFKVTVAPLINKNWAIISIFEQWELGVPEMEHHIVELCRWFKENGCTKDCHVYSPNIFKKMQLENIIPTTDATYERCVFENVDEAINWLGTHGFTISQPQFLYDNGPRPSKV